MTGFLTVYKSGIPWSLELLKFRKSKWRTNLRSMLELRTERPPTAPTQLSKHLVFSAAASATARRVPPRERLDSHLSLLILEERWANLAQLFTFYWDLTRNKFSFPLNAFVTRSPLLNRFPRGTPSWNFEQSYVEIIWSTGQDWGPWAKGMEGSQTPRPGSTRHITYPQGSDISAFFRNYL